MKSVHGERTESFIERMNPSQHSLFKRKKHNISQKQYFHSQVLLYVLSFIFFSPFLENSISAVQFHPSLVPESRIKQKKTESLPYWKSLWDEARLSARNGNYKKSVQKYTLLLKNKADLNEARWELAVILLHLGDNDQGVKHLELLVEALPDQPDYLNKLAGVLAKRGYYARAVDLYSRSNTIKPDNESVLSGLSTSLIMLNKKKEALPFLEKLYEQKKTDQNVRNILAILYYDLGLYSKAEKHLVVLSESTNANEEILVLAAKTLDKLGKKNTAVGYWHRVLQQNSGNEEGRTYLAAFYKNTRKVNETLAYFLSLLEMTPKNPALLNQIGRIYVETGRPSQGLPYLEHYVELRPDDKETLQYVVNLTLDLARYSLGKGDLRKSNDYLARLVVSDEQSPDFLLGRGALLEKLYRHEDAIRDYEKLLLVNPKNNEIRLRVVRLAGKTGDAVQVQNHFNLLEQPLSEKEKIKAQLVFAQALMECGILEGARGVYKKIIESKFPDKLKIYAYLGLADCYEILELPYEEEQSLRVALSLYESHAILAKLFKHALQYSKNEDDAQYWLRRFNDYMFSQEEIKGENIELHSRAQMMHAKLLASQGAYRAAIRLGLKLLEDIERVSGEGRKLDEREDSNFLHTLIKDNTNIDFVEVGLTLGRFYLDADKVELAEMQIMETNTYEIRDELKSLVLLQQIYTGMEEYILASEAFAGAVTIAGRNIGAMIYLAGLYEKAKLSEEMLQVAKKIMELWPYSLKGNFLYAQALEMNGELDQSLLVFRGILEKHPANMWALSKEASLLYLLGKHGESLSVCNTILIGKGIKKSPDIQLLKARNLWALSRWQDSIDVYKEYLDPNVDDLIVERITQEGLPLVKPQRKKTFLDYITFSQGKDSRLINQILSPSFAHENKQEANMLKHIASSHYAQYRWQEQFAKELKKRLTIQRRQ